MRSRPYKQDIRERIKERAERHLYACKCPRRQIAVFDRTLHSTRLLTGTSDCSRHRCGRAMRLWWRMKRAGRYETI